MAITKGYCKNINNWGINRKPRIVRPLAGHEVTFHFDQSKPHVRIRADLELASEYYLNKSRRWFKDNHIGIALPPLVNCK